MTKYELIKPPSTLLRACQEVEISYASNGELVMSLIELSTEYSICRQRVASLIDFYNLVDISYSSSGISVSSP